LAYPSIRGLSASVAINYILPVQHITVLKLENVAIANALQLEVAEPRQSFSAVVTTPCQV